MIDKNIQQELNINIPSEIQGFDNVQIDLSENENMYMDFLDIALQVKNPNKEGQTFIESLNNTVNNPLFKELNQNEKQIALDDLVNDYSELAKNDLRSKYPLIDQLIFEEQLKEIDNDSNS